MKETPILECKNSKNKIAVNFVGFVITMFICCVVYNYLPTKEQLNFKNSFFFYTFLGIAAWGFVITPLMYFNEKPQFQLFSDSIMIRIGVANKRKIIPLHKIKQIAIERYNNDVTISICIEIVTNEELTSISIDSWNVDNKELYQQLKNRITGIPIFHYDVKIEN